MAREDDRPARDAPRRAVLFADLLGFASLSSERSGEPARDALRDVASLLSADDDIARFLQSPTWEHRLGLSDSMFLVSSEPHEACAAAAELFFRVAFATEGRADPPLLRGAVGYGAVELAPSLFEPGSMNNLVGQGVVDAVRLEATSGKGPRLFLTDDLATLISGGPYGWLVDAGPPAELLWLLPRRPDNVRPRQIGEVLATSVRLLLANARLTHADHYVEYVWLAMRSLAELERRDPAAADHAREHAGITPDLQGELRAHLTRMIDRPNAVLQSLDTLGGGGHSGR